METSDGTNIAMIIIASCFVTYIGFVVYNMSQVDAWRWTVFGGTFLLLGLTMQNMWGDWLDVFVIRPKQFMTASGLVGTMIGQPVPLPENRQKWTVSFNSSLIPAETKKKKLGGLWWLAGKATGVIIIEVIDKADKFRHIDQKDTENKNGCVLYMGRLDGQELTDPDIMGGQAEIQRLTDQVASITTSMKIYGQQLAAIVNQRQFDDEHSWNRAKMLSDNVRNVKILPKGSGSTEEVLKDMM